MVIVLSERNGFGGRNIEFSCGHVYLCYLWSIEVSIYLVISWIFKFELRGEVNILNVV